MSPVLQVENLVLGYERYDAVKGISLLVHAGSVVTLIGANGAGKTTTLRGLSGLVRARSGRILFNGDNITALPAYQIARSGITQVPEGRQIYAGMSISENLALGAYMETNKARVAQRREHVLSLFPRLRERLGQSAGLLSGGEQQMLAMGMALMADPKLLLLDEPSMGLAPLFIEEIFRIIATLKQEGRTILLVEQNASAALEIADYAYVLEDGHLSLEGPAADIAQNPKVAAAYLGM
ncbi:MAG: ABC transporter ATP-binding protein [Hyphomicrobiales bacterium]|nr:ABC transporter ATP-binding protein [Hyphomicrobiales bacterium]MDE2113546.1 ABC transporter ATP-binding protein [Hyphomicrobiales bacterium]